MSFLFKNHKGVTYVEVLVGTALFLVIAISVYSLFSISLRWITSMKARVEAVSIANEQVEIIRNMPYDDIKTTSGWVPPGPIPSNQTVTRGGINFQVNIVVSYVNDTFDGTSLASVPPDTYPWDYKRVEVKVNWPGLVGNKKPVLFNTIVAPKGLEGMTAGKGGIWIRVFDASGNGVVAANVHAENTNLDPDYIIDTSSDSNGNVFLTDLDPDTQNYEVSVTKVGYSSEQTYSVQDLTDLGYPGSIPEKYPLSVIVGQVTEESFAIDLLSNLTINTVNENIPAEFRVNSDVGSNEQSVPHLAVDSLDNIYFVWHDKGDNERNYVQKYDTSGNSLLGADKRLADPNNQNNPRVVVGDNNDFFVTWHDERNGNRDIYLDRFSKDDGTDLWSGSRKINTDAGSADQLRPDLAVDSINNIVVSWVDSRNGSDNDIYLHKFDKDGNAVWGSEIKVNSDIGANSQSDATVLVDKSNNNIFVFWSDNRGGNWDIYMNKIDTNGTKLWGSDIKVNTNSDASNQSFPDAAIDSIGNVYVVWSDDRNGITNFDVYAQKYDASGVRASTGIWVGGDVKMNSDTTTTKQENPTITIDGGNNIFVAWSDERNTGLSEGDIYLQKFNSDGGRIWPDDIRVNNDLGLYVQTNPELAILGDGRVVVTWQDNRNSNLDIYAAIYSEPGSDIRGSVPLKIYLDKKIGTDSGGASIYKYLLNSATDVTGILILNNIEWGNYRIEVTGGLYTLLATTPLQPITLNPNLGQTAKVNVDP